MDVDATAISEDLRAREPIFHRRELGTSRRDFEAMIAEDYWEVGASGAVYDRRTVLDELERRYASPAYEPLDGLEVTESACRPAGVDAWLATYRLRQGERLTRRVTIWRRAGGRWVALYHQGSIIG